MELFVAGCHGGETPKHRTSAFVIDDRLAIDAGALTSMLDLKQQARINSVLVSHAHLDHVRDLAMLTDNRFQVGAGPLRVYATKPTLHALRTHFFNGALWPDFSKIPSRNGRSKAPPQPSLIFEELKLERPTAIGPYTVTAIPVSHTIDTAAFIVESSAGAIAYSGDTGPTEKLWTALNRTAALKLLLLEVSFPNNEQHLATLSGHHTPSTLIEDLRKFEKMSELDVLLYHIKPVFEARVEREVARIRGANLHVPKLGDRYRI